MAEKLRGSSTKSVDRRQYAAVMQRDLQLLMNEMRLVVVMMQEIP